MEANTQPDRTKHNPLKKSICEMTATLPYVCPHPASQLRFSC
jgi:hypothetical protein